MADCVFCRIVTRAEPADIVQEWYEALAFRPLNPVTAGHVLVIPKVHVPDAAKWPHIAGMTMAHACQYAGQLGDFNLITSRGRAATQSVDHLHIHVVPRGAGDGLVLPWTARQEALRAAS